MKFAISSSLVLLCGSVHAQPKGPDPVASDLERDGPFSIQTISISDRDTPGFNACDLYAPTATNVGLYGGVAVVPGFTNTRVTTAFWSRRVATHGFMVLNCNTESGFNFPEARGEQLLAAISWLKSDSPVANRIDPNRMAVAGYSMGGGGALDAIEADRSIAAAIGLSPYNSDKDFSSATTPTLLIGGENDGTASVRSHAIPFYNTLAGEKAYLELNNGDHAESRSDNPAASLYSIAWLKAFVDGDARYSSFVCPGPSSGGDIEDYRSSCTGPRVAGSAGLEQATNSSNAIFIGAIIGGVVCVAALVAAMFSLKRKSTRSAISKSRVVPPPDMI